MQESFIARSAHPERVLRDDAILAGVIVAVNVLFGGLFASPQTSSWFTESGSVDHLVGILVGTAMCGTVMIRRTNPVLFAMLTAVFAAAAHTVWREFDLIANAFVLVGVYSVAALAPRRLRLLGLVSMPFAVVLFYGGIMYDWYPRFEPSMPSDGRPTLEVLVACAFVVTAYLAALGLGVARRGRLDVLAREREEARLRAQDAHRLAQLAVADERARISREMHDIIAHSLASVVTLAEGGRFAAHQNAELSTELFEKIAETGRDALTDVKRLLRNVRDTQEDSPAHGPAQIAGLVERTALAGLPIAMHVSGTPRELPTGLGLAVFRVAQESVTNVLKHAPGSRTELRLDWRDDVLEFSCENMVEASAPMIASVPVDGRGIAGMRERVELFDGTIDVDRVGSLFRVRVAWPLPESASTPK